MRQVNGLTKNGLYKLISNYARACVEYDCEVDRGRLDERARGKYRALSDLNFDMGVDSGFVNFLADERPELLDALAAGDLGIADLLFELYAAFNYGARNASVDLIEYYECDSENDKLRKSCFKAVYASGYFKGYREDSIGSFAKIISVLLARSDMRYTRGIRLSVYDDELYATNELSERGLVKMERKKNKGKRMRVKIPQSVLNHIYQGHDYIAESVAPKMVIADCPPAYEYTGDVKGFYITQAFDHTGHGAN